MKVSCFIIKELVDQGVDCIFGYAGGAITHFLDSIHKNPKISFISNYHEQASAFSAEGYARVNNKLGVAIATSGPGATNLITGIGSSFFDSIPCLYITGQVNTYEYKGNLKIRQKGFQETDIISLVKPITKYAVRVVDPHKIKFELQKAIHLATTGRKGPVLLDIPMDIQRSIINVDDLPVFKQKKKKDFRIGKEKINEIITMINASKRPVLLVGGGVRLSGAVKELNTFLKKTSIPVVSSLMGLDAVDHNLENYLGFIGVYGNRYGNFTLANSDLIISIGSRLDVRQTSVKKETFARGAKLIRVDIDEIEFQNKIKKDEIEINLDAKNLLEILNKNIDKINIDTTKWLNRAKKYKKNYPSHTSKKDMSPNNIIKKISEFTNEEEIICVDVGQNQIWIAQSFVLKAKQRLLISGGMASMGFSVPAAIGAYYANPKKNIIAFVGDGGMQINIQELQLVKRNKIPIKIIILNNNCLGMIRHFQEMYFNGMYEGTLEGYDAPNFCKIAQAYGLDSVSIDTYEELLGLKDILREPKAKIININLKKITYVFPKLAMGRPIEDQDPLLAREIFKKEMIVKPMEIE
jgi:acetolactate synthase I/II/III large subunit